MISYTEGIKVATLRNTCDRGNHNEIDISAEADPYPYYKCQRCGKEKRGVFTKSTMNMFAKRTYEHAMSRMKFNEVFMQGQQFTIVKVKPNG